MDSGMKTCHLQDVSTLQRFFTEIAQAFAFPRGFEADMDGLWDALIEAEGPLRLVWERPGTTRDALGEEYWMLLEILADAVAERGDFELVLR